MASLPDLAARWRNDLASWAIPERILAAVDESPWTMPPAVFARRADQQLAAPAGPTHHRVLEALPPGGTVLDVGAGAGAASLPAAAGRGARVTAVDLSEEMLEELEERAARLGVPATCVPGRWPDVVAATRPPEADPLGCDPFRCDVAVSKDVVYNVPELPEFLAALTRCAARRVVIELTERHPLSPLNPLWARLHGLDRPDRPTAADVQAIAAELGLEPRAERWRRPGSRPYETFEQLVEMTRTRLCVPRERTAEVARALRELGADAARPVLPGAEDRPTVTLWWRGTR